MAERYSANTFGKLVHKALGRKLSASKLCDFQKFVSGLKKLLWEQGAFISLIPMAKPCLILDLQPDISYAMFQKNLVVFAFLHITES